MGLRTAEHRVLTLYSFKCLLYLIFSTGSFGHQRYPLAFEHLGTPTVTCELSNYW